MATYRAPKVLYCNIFLSVCYSNKITTGTFINYNATWPQTVLWYRQLMWYPQAEMTSTTPHPQIIIFFSFSCINLSSSGPTYSSDIVCAITFRAASFGATMALCNSFFFMCNRTFLRIKQILMCEVDGVPF